MPRVPSIPKGSDGIGLNKALSRIIYPKKLWKLIPLFGIPGPWVIGSSLTCPPIVPSCFSFQTFAFLYSLSVSWTLAVWVESSCAFFRTSLNCHHLCCEAFLGSSHPITQAFFLLCSYITAPPKIASVVFCLLLCLSHYPELKGQYSNPYCTHLFHYQETIDTIWCFSPHFQMGGTILQLLFCSLVLANITVYLWCDMNCSACPTVLTTV